MSKIICDVCGTSYPETSGQCPICGCVHSAVSQNVLAESHDAARADSYQHVKGGRFSKANVRKRVTNPQLPVRENSIQQPQETRTGKGKKSGNTGLVITVFVLLIAIAIVIGYIAIKMVGSFDSGTSNNDQPQVASEDIADATEQEILCQQITMENAEFSLEEVGQKLSLKATVTPADTTQEVSYTSDNEAVVTVDQVGVVTAVSYGEATITVTCGSISTQCKIKVAPAFNLNKESIVLESVGQTMAIYSGPIDLAEITWTTEDPAIATVENGTVEAVAAGTTVVHGEYMGTVVDCNVECAFVEPTDLPQEPTVSTTETQPPAATGGAAGPFKLKNLYGGRSDDVTLVVGDTFKLVLIDANGNTVEGVEWSVSGTSSTVRDGVVQAVASGYSEVTATYNGETYMCIVRVR